MKTQQQKTTTKSKSAAQASSKTIVGKAKKPLSEKTIQGIAELRALSEEANRIRMEYALAGGVMPSVNTVLLCMYEDQTGCKDFRTFVAWKEAGYSVRKGEKAFRLWGQPIKKGGSEELPDDAPEGTISDESTSNKKLWPTCCVFNESQVELIDSPSDKGEANQEIRNDGKGVLPSGWGGVAGGTIATNPDPIMGGIIDQEIVSGKWFAIFNRADLPTQSGFENRSDAISAFNEAIANGEATAGDEQNAFVRTDYSDHQESRRDRYGERAEKARKESTAQYQRSHSLVGCIPAGQPILVGHHSERNHRSRLDKSWSAMGRSVALSEKAGRLDSRAESVGTGGIASDDPEALRKLKAKLNNLVAQQERMKAANKLVVKNDLQGLVGLGFSETDAKALLTPDRAKNVGFQPYTLQNNNAEIRRIKKRIESLEHLHTSEPFSYENDNFKVYIADGRVRVAFAFGKPSDEVRQIMDKEYSFNWSRYSVEWVRKATPNAVASAPRLVARLNGLDSIY